MSLNGSASFCFQPPQDVREKAYISNMDQYRKMYTQSIKDPSTFWMNVAKEFYWKKPPTKEKFFEYNFDPAKGDVFIKWMQGAVTNVCYNVLDRIIEQGKGNKVAFYWEGNDPTDMAKITYNQLLTQVCKFANVLKSKGVKKGDRVAVYMPMVNEIIITMLACARIGAVHSIVFGGFSSRSLAERILDARCCVLITTDGVWRGKKVLNLKQVSDGAIQKCEEMGHSVQTCIVMRHLSASEDKLTDSEFNGVKCDNENEPGKRPCHNLKVPWTAERDCWWHEEMLSASSECEPEWLDAEDPLFMLYTSGSTGVPKGVLHTCGGYLLYAATTFKYVFDYHDQDVYWCTADVGWITGHSYVCYGPMANAATSVIFEGVPIHPDPGRFWDIIDKYNVNQFYTAPTAIRSLMKFGDDYVNSHCLDSLRILGTVGEPINPEAWHWYHRVVGRAKCAIVDTFWQTETGGHALTPLPGATPTKPGSATFPFFGIVPELLTEEGKLIQGEGEGYLVFSQPWPGIMRTVYGNHTRFETTYFKKFPGYYCTGDGARRDADGYIWVTGRIDDMLNVSGHLLSTSEVESALIEHPDVTETAVVAHPHSIKGESLYCFVSLKQGKVFTSQLVTDLQNMVRQKIGAFAQPDFIQEAPELPKTRSGKIMRRVLRKVAVGDREIGDVSTMADESLVEELFRMRPKRV